jgi:lipoprotein NlpI
MLTLIIVGCAPTVTELADSDPKAVIANKEELLKGSNVPDETIQALINAHNNLGTKALADGDYSSAESQFNNVLKIQTKNKSAQYGLAMISGHRFFKKGSNLALWKALEQYSKAAYYNPEKNDPYYWMGRTYEKKDSKDFELIIESYQKSLEGNLDENLTKDTEQRLSVMLKKQKIYEDFWK